jgi:hypothetical protein
MHPYDVAELVGEQVDELRRQVARRPELEVSKISLAGPTDLRVALPLRLMESSVAQERGIFLPGGKQAVRAFNVPILGSYQVRPVILRLDGSSFDGDPPTAELWDSSEQPLPAGLWPREASGGGIVGGYSRYPRPFFCRPGLREFHDHPEHEDKPWDRYREGFTLTNIILGLLTDLKLRWVMG